MNERLVLQDLIDILAKKQDITKKDAELFLRELIAVISETIETNESVRIKDLGAFKLVKINVRKSVDVNTGEAIEIPAHYRLSFSPDRLLKEAVNRPFAHFETVILEEGISFENIETDNNPDAEEDELDESTAEEKNITPPAIPKKKENIAEKEVETEELLEEKEEIILPVLESEKVQDIVKEISETINANLAEEQKTPQEETLIEETLDEAEEVLMEETIEKAEEETPLGIYETTKPETASDIPGIENIVSEDKDEIPEELLTEETHYETEDFVENKQESEDDASEIFAHKTDFKPSVAVKVGSAIEEEILYEEEERKTKQKKYVTIGFVALAVIAALIIGGKYFQQFTGYLDKAISDDPNKIQYDYTGLPHDSLRTDTRVLPDTVSAEQTVQTSQEKKEATPIPDTKEDKEERTTSSLLSVDVSKPLAIEPLQAGQTMRLISLKHYGHRSFWPYIYEENKDKIKNPNSIPIGTKLIIPSPAKYGIDAKDKASINKAKKLESKIVTELGL